ncbi:hypothetical protein [Polyangium mundeleinium]|uniref:Uncharacterized protein n=1 Tax=Polyangium mundeleinium TaxID=2995306 RepID=A0ABT5F4W8_9BACT|nr:hypothetical protein [Polyangium mundeleinium]MDC0748136.1 hypothetical protein [Polyangium mundeleinium]
MSTLRTFVRPLALALAFAFAAAPLAASAEEKGKAPKVEKVDKKKHGKGEFPMDSTRFDEKVEAKIKHAREQMESLLAAHPLPEPMKAQIRKDFEAGAAAIRAAAKEAGKDGKVTRDEAKDVKKLARDLKKTAHEKYGKEARRDGKKRERREKRAS